MKIPASKQSAGASYIPKTVILNGKSSMTSEQNENKLGALVEIEVLVDSLKKDKI